MLDPSTLLSLNKAPPKTFSLSSTLVTELSFLLTMGLNNVRSGRDLFTRAGSSMEIPSVIPEFGNLPMTIVGYNFDQDDLDQHVTLLRYGHSDTWIHLLISEPRDPGETRSARTITFGHADEPWKVSKVHVSQGLRAPQPRSFVRDGDEEKPGAPELAYIMVFQGRSGAIRSKLVLRSNLDLAGAEMFHMAANGFSVGFSGAMLKKNLEKRRDGNYSFKRVDNLDELQAVDSDQVKKVIGIPC